MQTLKEFLKEKKFSFTPDFSGIVQRFDRNGKTLSGWAVCKQQMAAGTPVQMAMFGDFATGEKHEWWSRKPVSKEEAKAMHAVAQEERKKFIELKKLRQAEAEKECKDFWGSLPDFGGLSPYAQRKGIVDLLGARADEDGNLFVPLGDGRKPCLNLQRITPKGEKRFWPGGRIQGCYFTYGCPPENPTHVYLCEGYATGASIYEALLQEGSGGVHQDEDAGRERAVLDSGELAQKATAATSRDGGVSSAHARKTRGQQGQAHGEDGALRPTQDRDGSLQLESELLAAFEAYTPGGSEIRRAEDRGPESLEESPAPTWDSASEFRDNALYACAPISGGGSGDRRPGARAGDETTELGGSDDTRGNPAGRAPDGLREARQFLVACAFNAGNLIHAARAIRKRFGESCTIVICGDDDRWTEIPDPNNSARKIPTNPGRIAAREAALDVGGWVALPRWEPDDLTTAHRTDFNDLVLLPQGLARVSESLRTFVSPEKLDATVSELRKQPDLGASALPAVLDSPDAKPQDRQSLVTYKKGGAYELPAPQVIADALLAHFDGKFVKQGKDLFHYTGTHWEHLGDHQMDGLKLTVQDMCDNLAGPGQLENYIEMFRINCPPVPEGRNLFASDPWTANFLNGTLHVVKNCVRYNLEFRPHAKEDFLCNVLPYEYRKPEDLPRNAGFDDMLDRIFAGDSDAPEKRRAVGQLFGACLCPMAPRLFMLFGEPGTGKSSLIKLAARLVHPSNTCSVDPADFVGFNLESMVGKLVNFNTDISTNKPINDAVVKKIEDRVPFRISRKYEKDILAPLPSVHIFGGNSIPPTAEGISRAHNRRWTFLKFSRVMTDGNNYDRDFPETVFDQEPLGILRFALEGLEDLLQNNRLFVQPASGKAHMEEWQTENDLVGAFLQAVREGEAGDGNTALVAVSTARIERAKLYDLFKIYCADANPSRKNIPSRSQFYRYLEGRDGLKEKTIRGTRYIEGVGLGIEKTALM